MSDDDRNEPIDRLRQMKEKYQKDKIIKNFINDLLLLVDKDFKKRVQEIVDPSLFSVSIDREYKRLANKLCDDINNLYVDKDDDDSDF